MWDSDEEDEKKDARREVLMKRVAFTPPPSAPVKPIVDELDDLARKMHKLDIRNSAYSVCYTRLAYLAPTAAQAWPAPKTFQLINVNSINVPLPYLPLPPPSGPITHQSNPTCFFCGHHAHLCSCRGISASQMHHLQWTILRFP